MAKVLINDSNAHEAALNRGLATLLRMMDGKGKVVPVGAERDEALLTLHSLRVALAGAPSCGRPAVAHNAAHTTVSHLVAIRHHLAVAAAEAEPPAPAAA